MLVLAKSNHLLQLNMTGTYYINCSFFAIIMALFKKIKDRYYKVLQRSYFWELKRCKKHKSYYECKVPGGCLIIRGGSRGI